MPSESQALRKRLREAGIAPRTIRAIWPTWWSEEAEASRSAVVELRYTVARRLGSSPRSLFENGSPEFLWKDAAKFKNVGTQGDDELAILTSFGVAVGQALLAASPGSVVDVPSAAELRAVLLRTSPAVDLRTLLDLAWAVGIPVAQLALFPLGAKRMHAITVRVHGRYAILVGRQSPFPAQVAYLVAHELGHVASGHVSTAPALVEAEDPLTGSGDDEEHDADAYALELLTGDPHTVIEATDPQFSAVQLANAAIGAARELRIDPGVLALCLGHSSGRWKQAFAALKLLPPGPVDVRDFINGVARHQLRWNDLSGDAQEFLSAALGIDADPS